MKRDRQLIRAILEYLAAQPGAWAQRPEPLAGCESVEIFTYHLSLCEQAGFVAVRRASGKSQKFQLTWTGHEALDAMLP